MEVVPFQDQEEGLRAVDLGKVSERKQKELTYLYKLCQNPCYIRNHKIMVSQYANFCSIFWWHSNGAPLQCSCLENPMDGGAWWAAVHGLAESWTDSVTSLSLFTSCIGEGNGNPLQCSCLENPRDRGAWWAAIYGVAQSRIRLKGLSSRVDEGKSLNSLMMESFLDWECPRGSTERVHLLGSQLGGVQGLGFA